MKINYDKIADAIYINFRQGKVAETRKFNDEMLIDVDANGSLVGLEVVCASKFNSTTKTLEQSVLDGIPVEIFAGTPATA